MIQSLIDASSLYCFVILMLAGHLLASNSVLKLKSYSFVFVLLGVNFVFTFDHVSGKTFNKFHILLKMN